MTEKNTVMFVDSVELKWQCVHRMTSCVQIILTKNGSFDHNINGQYS